MARVICDISTSLDGYVTGPNDSRENPFGDGAGMLHDWMFDAATDEYRINVQSVALGDGLPLLHGLREPLRLELVSSTAWADGPITQTYAPR